MLWELKRVMRESFLPRDAPELARAHRTTRAPLPLALYIHCMPRTSPSKPVSLYFTATCRSTSELPRLRCVRTRRAAQTTHTTLLDARPSSHVRPWVLQARWNPPTGRIGVKNGRGEP